MVSKQQFEPSRSTLNREHPNRENLSKGGINRKDKIGEGGGHRVVKKLPQCLEDVDWNGWRSKRQELGDDASSAFCVHALLFAPGIEYF